MVPRARQRQLRGPQTHTPPDLKILPSPPVNLPDFPFLFSVVVLYFLTFCGVFIIIIKDK